MSADQLRRRSIYVDGGHASSADKSNIRVCVRIRPLSAREALTDDANNQTTTNQTSVTSVTSGPGGCVPSSAVDPRHVIQVGVRTSVRVIDDHVIVFDPSDGLRSFRPGVPTHSNRRIKDIKYAFNRVFPPSSSQRDVYDAAIHDLLDGVLDGYNATVFAYGATGAGKTHTISGSLDDPGIMPICMTELFKRIQHSSNDHVIEVSVSYLEVYNETIRDLLAPQDSLSTPLDLREDQSQRVAVAGLSEHHPTSEQEVLQLLERGNANRTKSATKANEASSRSHAIFQINIQQRDKSTGVTAEIRSATLTLCDLAGSERASVTENRGQQMREGANINKSLLALGNCINALCEGKKNAHIPYRDSKLTRLLKYSLGGNCRTVMIANISPSMLHFEETHNTLKYANRAKQIKLTVERNTINVNHHISQYVEIIESLRKEIEVLKAMKSSSSGRCSGGEEETSDEHELVSQLLIQIQESATRVENVLEAHVRTVSSLELAERQKHFLSEWMVKYTPILEGSDVSSEWNTLCADAVAELTKRIVAYRNDAEVLDRKLKDAKKSFDLILELPEFHVLSMANQRKVESEHYRVTSRHETMPLRIELEMQKTIWDGFHGMVLNLCQEDVSFQKSLETVDAKIQDVIVNATLSKSASVLEWFSENQIQNTVLPTNSRPVTSAEPKRRGSLLPQPIPAKTLTKPGGGLPPLPISVMKSSMKRRKSMLPVPSTPSALKRFKSTDSTRRDSLASTNTRGVEHPHVRRSSRLHSKRTVGDPIYEDAIQMNDVSVLEEELREVESVLDNVENQSSRYANRLRRPPSHTRDVNSESKRIEKESGCMNEEKRPGTPTAPPKTPLVSSKRALRAFVNDAVHASPKLDSVPFSPARAAAILKKRGE